MPRRGSPSPSSSASRGSLARPGSSRPTTQNNQPKPPGLLKQSAAIAGGVALGSTVGHVLGNALVGGRAREYYEQVQNLPVPSQDDPCVKEITAFVKCAKDQQEKGQDITICEGFVEAIRQCRNYGTSAVAKVESDQEAGKFK